MYQDAVGVLDYDRARFVECQWQPAADKTELSTVGTPAPEAILSAHTAHARDAFKLADYRYHWPTSTGKEMGRRGPA